MAPSALVQLCVSPYRGLAFAVAARYSRADAERTLHRPFFESNELDAEVPPFAVRHWFWIGLAVAVAAALRFTNLGAWSLWIDEAHSWRDATIAWDALDSERKLYALTFLLLRALLAGHWISGDEASLRLPFALVGVATVPLLAMCGRRVIGRWPAVLAAWFCALNPWHVFWSQNARGYVLMFAFAVIASNRGAKFADTQRLRDFFATMVAVGVSALCHPTGATQALGVIAFMVLRTFPSLRGRVLVRIAVGAVAIAVLLPWIVAFLPFQGFLNAKNDPSLLHFAQTTAYYYMPVVLLAAAVGLLLAWRQIGRERALLLACLWLVPFLVLTTIGAFVAKVTARYSLCTLPVVTWLAAYACCRVAAAAAGERRSWPRLAMATLLPLVLLAQYSHEAITYHVERFGDRARWRQACEFVTQEAGGGRVRVLTLNHPTVLYYLRPRHWEAREDAYPDLQVVPLLDDGPKKGKDEAERVVCEPGAANFLRYQLGEARSAGAKFFVLVTLPELAEIDTKSDADPAGAILATLQQQFDLVLHLPCWVGPKDESIYVYAPKPE